jgi:hypothetical protein
MPTIDDIQTQVHELEGKALDYVQSVQAPVTEYVGKATAALAERLPADRPELLTQVIDLVVRQAEFAKQAVDAQGTFTKAVIDAAVKPFAPAKKKAAVKAA